MEKMEKVMSNIEDPTGAGELAFCACKGTSEDKILAYFNAEPRMKNRAIRCGRALRLGQPPPSMFDEASYAPLRENNNADYVAGIIRGEEEKYLALLDRAPKIVTKWFKHREVTGETLAQLWHTHGLDVSVVEAVIGTQSTAMHEAFQRARDVHKQTGKGRKENEDE